MTPDSKTQSGDKLHQRLKAHAKRLQAKSLSSLFNQPNRAADFSLGGASLNLDFSKQLIDEELLETLAALAEQSEMATMRSALFSNTPINSTEGRAALHTLLRTSDQPNTAELSDQYEQIQLSLVKISDIVDAIRSGKIKGHKGDKITDVVNIGIGGSYLGPRLVTRALTAFQTTDLKTHYVANIDPVDLSETLALLSPESTLFIICSKSFVSTETLQNAELAIDWLRQSAQGKDVGKQLIAVTADSKAAIAFGVAADHIVPMWDWVGGRYSLWSGVGLSAAIAIGMDNFKALLSGAEAMDRHFQNTPWKHNIPAIMALLEHWSVNYLGCRNHAVIPYAQTLHLLPAYLQQLSMESNGKRVDVSGAELSGNTAPILWGDVGTSSQHSFHQLLHQGTISCPVDFILPLSNPDQNLEQQAHLVANCIAQSQALMVGHDLQAAKQSLLDRGLDTQRADEVAPHLVIPGNRPSNTLTMEKLSPATLGALLALYEHKTACCAALWNINPFDQWGVELGKELGKDILKALGGEQTGTVDTSTQALIDAYRKCTSFDRQV